MAGHSRRVITGLLALLLAYTPATMAASAVDCLFDSAPGPAGEMVAEAEPCHQHAGEQAVASEEGQCFNHKACSVCHSGSLPPATTVGLTVSPSGTIIYLADTGLVTAFISAEIRPPIPA